MAFAAIALWALLANAQPGVTPPGWEKIFESSEPKAFISSVLAFDRDDWFVGGVWGAGRATAGGVERTVTKPRAILGLFGVSPESVFAFGDDELVMRWDGKKWIEEHVGPKPKRPGRGADILYSGFYEDTQPVAFGVSLLLVRRTDGNWFLPPEPKSKKLFERGQLGPSFSLPDKCAKAGWFWLGKDKGMFHCHDGRSFVFDAGKIVSKGKLPAECRRSFNAVTFGQGELYASCGPDKVWKTAGDSWNLYATFKDAKGVDISVKDRCVFVAGARAVWRSCR